jgi:uncharacterized protein (TIGR03437 family)
MKNLVRLFLLSAATLAAQPVAINIVPSREFGQPLLPPTSTPFAFSSTKENYVEGRELSSPLSIAFDTSVTPPIVYVADTFNNRVLAWRNATSVSVANFADKVIGQNDLYSTVPGGPGTALTTGMLLPTAIAVDAKGNLYVMDSGNNRILRYPTPFSQTSGFQPVDLVIGQKTVSSGSSVNEGQANPSQKTLSLYPYNLLYTTSITFDAQGNLWVSDPGNYRVLRFPAGNLTAGNSEPSADVQLGQNDFVSAVNPAGLAGFTARTKSGLYLPSGLAFDQTGRLYVADSYSRVLQFVPPISSGNSAARILGIPQLVQGQTPTYPSQYTLGNGTTNGSPNGMFTIGNTLFVCDTAENRIVSYNDPTQWATESANNFSPIQQTVIGQPDFNSGKSNHGASQSDGNSFSSPQAAAVINNGAEMWVVDSGNNRVIALPGSNGQTFGQANRLLGQLDYIYGASNLVEGKELFLRSSTIAGGGVVIDKNSNPPHLYVADTFNNRVLGFTDARQVGTDSRNLLTAKADLVIGQPDLLHARPNYPGSDPTAPTPTGLNGPIGLVLDKNGNLYVADSGNARVVRFPAPFSQTSQTANLVLGQSNLTSKITDPTPVTMNAPWGLAMFSDGSIAVSDATHNRILIFQKPSGDFVSGPAASVVLGQSTFTSTTAGSGPGSVSSPRSIATDTSDRLYVTDPGNGRLLVWTRGSQSNGAGSSFQLPNLNAAQGVMVSTITGEIWLANSGANQIIRYPEFQTLQFNGGTPTATLSAYGPVAIALDAFDNVVALDAANRMTFYFASLSYRHLGNYNQQPVAPGMLAALFQGLVDNSSGNAFTGIADASASAYPWPTTLSDIQVQVNGQVAPIFKVLSGLIYFQVPANAPCGCNNEANSADFVVTRVSTQQILAAGTFLMRQASPGFFTSNAAGTGQIAAVNDDGTVNTSSNQIGRTKYISLYLTGQGRIPNMPPDGMPASGAVSIPSPTSVYMNPGPASALPASDVQYSGLTGFPGGWQMNVMIPNEVPPSGAVTVAVSLYDIQSNIGPGNARIVTTIAVK